MNTPTDKEVRDWYMGYGVDGRAELAEVEGNAFDRYLLERDARVAKETEARIIKLLWAYVETMTHPYDNEVIQSLRISPKAFEALIKGKAE